MPKVSINDRNRIIVLHEEGCSQVNIAKHELFASKPQFKK